MRLLQEAFPISMNASLQSLVSGIYAILQIQITKLNKAEYHYIGTKWGETKKEVKKSKGLGKFAAPAKFHILRNFAGVAYEIGKVATGAFCFCLFSTLKL